MKQYAKDDQVALAAWALTCARRVLPLFEQVAPLDVRPQQALAVGQDWVRTRLFQMALIRGASLGAHAAAKAVREYPAACFAAHAVGQAVATAHVTQHAYGGAYYALKALAAADAATASQRVAAEWAWQARQLPTHLQEEIMSRIVVEERRRGPWVSIRKGWGFRLPASARARARAANCQQAASRTPRRT